LVGWPDASKVLALPAGKTTSAVAGTSYVCKYVDKFASRK
jgi:hypothetical protein